ncbi:MAG: DoxX family protein [Flammeovirgaceae bacterium]
MIFHVSNNIINNLENSQNQSISRISWIHRLVILVVGGLFVFSGLIKLNDPVGTAIKLEEYFEVFAQDFADFFHYLMPFALSFSVILCTAEVVLGVALIFNYRRRLTISLLLLLVVFFTFLTFYSAYFNKVTDCGCFGDAIPLTAWQSFGKDVVLTILIGFLFFERKKIKEETGFWRASIVGISLINSLLIAYIAIQHLPFIDFRVYKIGNSISQLRKPQASCQYEYIMEKDGQIFIFKEYPTDNSYTFKEMRTLNSKECSPKITDYNLTSPAGDDFTEESLQGKKLMIIVHKTQNTNKESFKEINKLVSSLEGSDIQVIAMTSDAANFNEFRHEVQLAVPYYLVDGVVLKTMMRSDPGLMYVEDGVVKGKWHFNDVPDKEGLK